MSDARRPAAAAERNREPILEVLRRHVEPGAKVLEIASGSGNHAAFLAPRLEVASWQPSDPDPDARASIDAWRAETGDARVLPAIDLDVMRLPWAVESADVVVCINMIHIAPWSACVALLEGASEVLPSGGVLYLYGPYRRGGVSTAPSNEAFDESLRSRNPEWGVRDMEAVRDEAADHGLVLSEADIVPMPANNFSLVLRRAVRSAMLPA